MANKINGLTPDEWFEQFIKALEKSSAEFDQRLEKSSAEFHKKMEERDAKLAKEKTDLDAKLAKEKAERDAEYERRMAERDAKWEKQNDELNKQIGGVGRSIGKITEKLIYNSLAKEMNFAGIEFYDIQSNLHRKTKAYNNLEAEFDIFLRNTDTIAIIETKQNVEKEHITELIEKKLSNFRKLFSEYNKYKIILGMGGMNFEAEAINEANKNGIGLIKVSGEKVEFHTEGIRMFN